ncbi:hypothetical protein D8674_011006 [Pyrus ussuriensis x Pyrus communis]|uniref:Uncharacterized protein n=1 Tax=Pyrus ussuriensis x Pyrus communis TaxID=2448454 RepID=A0A5N5FXH2_9ROSA|nr:hypothetical protein D8674_011006 [Pyrus ussuriensis x Pyrus communis]
MGCCEPTLTKQIRSLDDGTDAMEQMQLLKPANVEKQVDWDKFVKHRCSPKFAAISEKFKRLKSFHTLLHVMSRKGYARLEDELRSKGIPEEDLNRVKSLDSYSYNVIRKVHQRLMMVLDILQKLVLVGVCGQVDYPPKYLSAIQRRYNVMEEVHKKLTMLLDKLPKLVPRYTRKSTK